MCGPWSSLEIQRMFGREGNASAARTAGKTPRQTARRTASVARRWNMIFGRFLINLSFQAGTGLAPLCAQPSQCWSVSRVAGEIVLFEWIALNVIKLLAFRARREPAKGSPAFGANAFARRNDFGAVVMFVEELFAPVGGTPSVQQRHEAAALHAFGNGHASHLQQGRRKIQIQRHRLHRPAALQTRQARIENNEGDSDALLIHEPFVGQTAFASEPAVVRGEDDDR